MSDDEPTDDSEQQEEQPAEGDQPTEQSEEQPADSDQPAEQSDNRPTDDTDKSAEQFDDTGGAPQKGTKTGDCSGWEGMPDIFAKRLADHYIRTELGTEPARLKSISGGPSIESTRSLVYDDGVEIWVILKYIPDHVIARAMSPLPEKQRCTYEYDCINPPSGPQLVFTKRSCDDYPP